MQASRLVRRHAHKAPTDLCSSFCSLYITARGLNTSASHRATGGSNNATPNPMHSAPPGTTKRDDKAAALMRGNNSVQAGSSNVYFNATERRRIAEAKKVAAEQAQIAKEEAELRRMQGGLAADSIFANETEKEKSKEAPEEEAIESSDKPLNERNPATMEVRLNPRPNARARWMRKMVIRDIHRQGVPTKEMELARSERTHTVKSHFFYTSVKKLAPLARQIAGKPIDEAIIQMRFSKKKAARNVLKHLIHARNEAIVIKGMGLPEQREYEPESTTQTITHPQYEIGSVIKTAVGQLNEPVLAAIQEAPIEDTGINITDPSNTPPLPTQRPDKSLIRGHAPNPTDMYVAQAWVNRGMYGFVPSPRARGRMDVLRPPKTGISVMIKEEKTRTREKEDKELKAIKKRLSGKFWTQLPDRPVTRQSQYVLW